MKKDVPQAQVQPEPKKRLIYVIIAISVIAIALSLWLLVKNNTVQAPATVAPAAKLNQPKVALKILVSGMAAPTDIETTKDAQDLRLFAVEQIGRIRVITAGGQLVTQPFLDISQKVLDNGEMGLLGLAFHPHYIQNGYFYINYVNKAQETIIARYKVSQQPGQADASSEKVLLRLKQPYPNHNGGTLQFGPDGFLYIGLGDGGSAGDPQDRAQNQSNLFGKILRIDVDHGDPYQVPVTNPFVAKPGAAPEIWAYGLRNPWRISFDRATGDLYIADVGQGSAEEVDMQKASSQGGENYGWRCYEGNQPYNIQACSEPSHYVAPVFTYSHEEGRCSITGGYVYRGRRYPTLTGKYFYGDYCSGQLFYATRKDGTWSQILAAKTPYAFSTFGQDSKGELYVADYAGGSIYKIIDSAN